MCCSDPPPPPDYGPLAESSKEVAEMARQTSIEQLAWAREQDTMNRATLDRVLAVQLPGMERQAQWAQEDRARYEDVYRPIEDNLIQDFESYLSPDRLEQERGRAMGDVATSFDAARKNALQRLESYGVDPSQTRNAALDLGVRTQQAAAQAAAGTNATRIAEDKGRALRADALNIGKGLPSQVAQSYGQAVAAGNSAIGGANSTTGTSTAAMAMPGQYMNTATNAYGQSANIMNTGYQNSMQAYSAQQQNTANMLQGVGGIAGMFLADGGAIPDAPPGLVDYGPSDGSGVDDQVHAQISVGEYVIPADVVQKKGVEFFDKLVEKYHTPAAEQRMGA